MNLVSKLMSSWMFLPKTDDERGQVAMNVPADLLELCETEDELAELMKLLSLSENSRNQSSSDLQVPQNDNIDQRDLNNNNSSTKRKKALSPSKAVGKRIRNEIRRLRGCKDMSNDMIMHYRTRSDLYCIPIKVMATRPFGFHFLQRIITPKGLATVLGVFRGCLFVQLDGEKGCSFWDNGTNYAELIKLGFHLADSQKPNETTLNLIAAALVKSTQLPLLNFTHMMLWHDVVTDTSVVDPNTQQLVQAFFGTCGNCLERIPRHRMCHQTAKDLLTYFFDKRKDKSAEIGDTGIHITKADFVDSIHSYYISSYADRHEVDRIKIKIRSTLGESPPTPSSNFGTPSGPAPYVPPSTSSSSSSFNYASSSSDPNSNAYSGFAPQKLIECPFCFKTFVESSIDEHAFQCATAHNKRDPQTENVLPSDINFQDEIDKFSYKKLDPRIIRAPSRIPTLWALCLQTVAQMDSDVILQLFAISATVDFTPAVSSAVKKMCLAHVRPKFDKMSLDQLREIPKEEREALVLERLQADSKTQVGTLESLAHFVNTNVSLDHTTVMKVIQKMLTTEVLISLFELCATIEEFTELDALRNFITAELKKVDLLRLQDSPKFHRLETSLQNVLIKICIPEPNSQPTKLTGSSDFMLNLEDPDPCDLDSDEDYDEDEDFMSDQEEPEEEEQEEE